VYPWWISIVLLRKDPLKLGYFKFALAKLLYNTKVKKHTMFFCTMIFLR